MMVPVIGFESEASLWMAVVIGTFCSRSALPHAFERMILLCEATATDSPGHFVAANLESIKDWRRWPNSGGLLICAFAYTEIKDNKKDHRHRHPRYVSLFVAECVFECSHHFS